MASAETMQLCLGREKAGRVSTKLLQNHVCAGRLSSEPSLTRTGGARPPFAWTLLPREENAPC